MSLQLRFAGPQATAQERSSALTEDLCRTRRGPRGTQSAFDLYDEARTWLIGEADLPGVPGQRAKLTDDPVWNVIDDAFQRLRPHREAIAAGSVRPPLLDELVATVFEASDGFRRLAQRYSEASHG
ncbi:MAG: hypothetical protein AAGA48_29775 [Myxococcota bacterium]